MAPDKLTMLFVGGHMLVILDDSYRIEEPPRLTVSDEQFAKLIQMDRPEPYTPPPRQRDMKQDWKERSRRHSTKFKT